MIGLPTLRLRGDYVGIVTLAFGEIIGQLVANGQEIHFFGGTLTGGPTGITAIDRIDLPFVGRFGALDLRPWYWFALALVALTLRRQLPAARLATRPRVDRAARRRGARPRARASRSCARSCAPTAWEPRSAAWPAPSSPRT